MIDGQLHKDIARFMKKVDKLPNGCWQWNAGTLSGYGQYYHTVLKHKVA